MPLGGKNPALRTFFYRLLRLWSLSVQPLLVFDGPNKPPFKRGRRTFHNATALQNSQVKQLLTLLGIPYHDAPGEAEAECALLQREGIVDAILSEDVDAIMFGCCLTLRNWSSEGTRGNKAPTHVSMYESQEIHQGKSGLTANGILLVALMSGGDYNPGGIPGCGIKLACEAARAGFGESLCKLAVTDLAESTGLRSWRERLCHELRTNESGFFRVKNKSIVIPEEFPNKETLNFYLNPSISSPEQLEQLKKRLVWGAEFDIVRLRRFVSDSFDWEYLSGAKKFIRVIAQSILVRRLMRRGTQFPPKNDQDQDSNANSAQVDVKTICGKRSVFSTGDTPELQITYVPLDVVGLDISGEAHAPEGERDHTTKIVREGSSVESTEVDNSVQRKRAKSIYDPSKLQRTWIGETLLRAALPIQVMRWEEDQRMATYAAKAKPTKKGRKVKESMEYGAMDRFVSLTRSFNSPSYMRITKRAGISAYELPSVDKGSPSSLAKRPPETLDIELPPGIRYSALGIDGDSRPVEKGIQLRKSSLKDLPEDIRLSKSGPFPSNNLLKDKLPDVARLRNSILRAQSSLTTNQPTGRHPNDNLSHREEHSLATSQKKNRAKHTRSHNQNASAAPLKYTKAPLSPLNRSATTSQDSPTFLDTTVGGASNGDSGDTQVIGTSQELPPYSTLLKHTPNRSTNKKATAMVQTVITLSSSASTPEASTTKKAQQVSEKTQAQPQPKRMVVLRESLEGAWRETDELDFVGSTAHAWREVEVVDLTGSGSMP